MGQKVVISGHKWDRRSTVTITLAEAVAILRAMDAPTTSDALALLVDLDPLARIQVLTPIRHCKGVNCGITPARVFRVQGCCCRQSAVALRLLDQARDLSAIEPEPPPQRFTRRCVACRLPYSTTRVNERYCPKCNDTAKRKRKGRAA